MHNVDRSSPGVLRQSIAKHCLGLVYAIIAINALLRAIVRSSPLFSVSGANDPRRRCLLDIRNFPRFPIDRRLSKFIVSEVCGRVGFNGLHISTEWHARVRQRPLFHDAGGGGGAFFGISLRLLYSTVVDLISGLATLTSQSSVVMASC